VRCVARRARVPSYSSFPVAQRDIRWKCRAELITSITAAIKAEVYPFKLYTSAGTVEVSLYDTTLHAKGGLPDEGFFRTADACLLMYDTTKQSR
jgi:hypothetical protein